MGDTEAVHAGLSPMDADTCGDETSMHLEGPQSLVNIAHIGKLKKGGREITSACISANEDKSIIAGTLIG